jgi:hypothetical protein
MTSWPRVPITPPARPHMTNAFAIREIADGDLPEVISLLCEGFPSRTPEYWRTGLQRLAKRERPPDTEKYGYVLVAQNALRGVVLTIPSLHHDGSSHQVFINISSWYAQPSFRGTPAKELYRHASRRQDVTYTNLSAAAHTIKTITSFGFEEWTAGQMVALGLKRDRSSLKQLRILTLAEAKGIGISLDESRVLADHADFGCLTFCLETANGLSPFIFVRRRIKAFVPCAQLIYCRNISDLIDHGRAISMWLAKRGFPLMIIDASGPIDGLTGHYVYGKASKYFKGPRPLKASDHSYSEMVFLGF